MPAVPHSSSIRLRLRELAQLFNAMDPSPLTERDLDAKAEEFIVSWARELSQATELELHIQLEVAPAAEPATTSPPDRLSSTQTRSPSLYSGRGAEKR